MSRVSAKKAQVVSRLLVLDRLANPRRSSPGALALLESLLTEDASPWQPHVLKSGPRKGKQVFKHAQTGAISDESPRKKGGAPPDSNGRTVSPSEEKAEGHVKSYLRKAAALTGVTKLTELAGKGLSSAGQKTFNALPAPVRKGLQKSAAVAKQAKNYVLGKIEHRYGKKATKVVLSATALAAPVPLPGVSVGVFAAGMIVCELARQSGLLSLGEALRVLWEQEDLSPEEIAAFAEELLEDLTELFEQELGELAHVEIGQED